jgi:hypothetical protein
MSALKGSWEPNLNHLISRLELCRNHITTTNNDRLSTPVQSTPQPAILTYFLILFPRLLLDIGKKRSEGSFDIEMLYPFLVSLILVSFPSPHAHCPTLDLKSCSFLSWNFLKCSLNPTASQIFPERFSTDACSLNSPREIRDHILIQYRTIGNVLK